MGYQSRISTKGQMVVPVDVRTELGFKPGDILDVSIERGRMIVRHQSGPKKKSYFDVFDKSPYKGPPMTVEKINEGIHAAMAERMKRKLARS
jgi:AbrB family looped-hinge helix DNA binding protein